MRESKSNATARLQREGRWEEATEFRDKERERCRAEGRTKRESNQLAWERMIDAFPALTVESSMNSMTSVPGDVDELAGWDEALSEIPEDVDPDIVQDIVWVYHRIAADAPELKSAPSRGALALLRWSKSNQKEFFEKLLPKALAAAPNEVPDERLLDNGESMQKLDRMVGDIQLNWERDAVKNTTETIRQTVSSRFNDWERRFGICLPDDARESWQLQMISLVDETVMAFKRTSN